MQAGWDLDNKSIIIAKEDAQAREVFLANHRSFIYQIASAFCKRTLSWNQDDELSIALIAFNHAISVYDPARGAPFLTFSRKVIQNRITDFLRKEGRHKHLSLEPLQTGEGSVPSQGELQAAWLNYTQEVVNRERSEEIRQYQNCLQEFGLSFSDLVTVSPKHRDTRENLMRAAMVLCADAAMQQSLLRKKQLPMKELALASGINLKTLERGRKYIIAVALVLSRGEEFLHLRSYIKFPEQRGLG